MARWLLILTLLAGCDRLQVPADVAEALELPQAPQIAEIQESQAERLISIAEKYLFVRETGGFNRSPEIDRWNRLCGVPLGSPYCASFVSAIHKEANVPAIVSAWSPDWGQKNLVPFSEIESGDVGCLYFPSKGRIAHVFLIEGRKGSYVATIEANTSADSTGTSAKSREGDGCFRKLRSATLLSDKRNKFSRWWK